MRGDSERFTSVDSEGPVKVPQGKRHRVVGMTSLSFAEETRDDFSTMGSIPVPQDSVYLSNMAVDPAVRRCVQPVQAFCHVFCNIAVTNAGCMGACAQGM
jgi:hypothetical protein